MAFQRKKPAAIGVKAPYPGFIEPELATSVDRVPSGARWIHEIKFDGYRKGQEVRPPQLAGSVIRRPSGRVSVSRWHHRCNFCRNRGVEKRAGCAIPADEKKSDPK